MRKTISPDIYSNHNFDGKKRRVGFEIESTGLSIDRLTVYLQELFGGDIHKKHRNLSILSNTRLGSFQIELDANVLKKSAEKSQNKQIGSKIACHWISPENYQALLMIIHVFIAKKS